jgi:hypothetical protein
VSQANLKNRSSPVLFATVTVEIEREDAFVIGGALKHFRMAQGANGVVVAGASVLLHAGDRRLHACVAQVLATRPNENRMSIAFAVERNSGMDSAEGHGG